MGFPPMPFSLGDRVELIRFRAGRDAPIAAGVVEDICKLTGQVAVREPGGPRRWAYATEYKLAAAPK